MKNNHSFYTIKGLLASALVAVCLISLSSCDNKSNTPAKFSDVASDSSLTLPVAFVRIDSLLLNYNYAKDMNETLMRKEENARATLNQKERQLQAAAQEFDRKLRNNAFLTDDRAKQEQQRIIGMQQDYEQTAQRLTQEFALEQQKLNIQLADTIKIQLEEYNKTAGYQIIFSNTGSDNILFADPKYDITEAVIKYLNKNYGPAKEMSTPADSTKVK